MYVCINLAQEQCHVHNNIPCTKDLNPNRFSLMMVTTLHSNPIVNYSIFLCRAFLYQNEVEPWNGVPENMKTGVIFLLQHYITKIEHLNYIWLPSLFNFLIIPFNLAMVQTIRILVRLLWHADNLLLTIAFQKITFT